MGPPDSGGTGLADPNMTHLALAHEVTHRADRVLDRHGRVDPVDVVEVDDFDLQARQALLAARPGVFGPAVRARHAGRDTEIAELGRDDVIVAVPLYRAGNQFLVLSLAVGIRGIEKIDADLARPLQGFDHGRSVDAS